MTYKCFNCKDEIPEKLIERRIICPSCGSRILIKTRPEIIKKVKAL